MTSCLYGNGLINFIKEIEYFDQYHDFLPAERIYFSNELLVPNVHTVRSAVRVNKSTGVRKMLPFSHLNSWKVNVGLVQEKANKDFLKLLDGCDGSKV